MIRRMPDRKSQGQYVRQSGVTLIEALITMVILSFGLLSVAALQLKSLQYATISYQRSIATIQASDLVERLWAGICVAADEWEDIAEDWEDFHAAEQNLPNWAGVVESPANLTYTVTISWDERVDDTRMTFVHTAMLPDLPGCN
ncbi:type IV pilus modification protein PilV [Thiocapsa marina]|uniref:Type IV pilus modification protein PilV n=1 Tax=Thiocapsa marina 5811 TaxID=768671 RepID=F9UH12_9GAMM|nr:type IV pilus modification protein PilV [Thiocapsa marina]EGV16510.1 type IV pilus modification protein PilV [Thiocapsa marina 5811]